MTFLNFTTVSLSYLSISMLPMACVVPCENICRLLMPGMTQR